MRDCYKKIFWLVIFISLTFICRVFAEEPGVLKVPGVAVVGDSYAGYFNKSINSEIYEYFIFPVGTIYNPLNQKVFEEAINSNNNYILFATGVNDQALNTELSVFEQELRKYAEEISAKNKFLFFHSYMDYPNKKIGNGSYSPSEYDRIYRKLADEYENVMYIDMSYFYNTKHGFGDGLHYDKFFYETLDAKLQFYVYSIFRSMSKSIGSTINEVNKKQIAVTGDIAAQEFFDYENKKEYVILNFSSPSLLLSQCKEQVLRAINYEAQSVFITSGLNDYEYQTDVEEFKDTLREYLNEACLKHKNVFLYASLDYENSKGLPIESSLYDMAVEDVANEYPNACFINLRNFSKEVPQIYDILYSLMDTMIKNIY
ncbi:MAG: hypothetical protein IKP66_07990 [Lachnospiraceae bacterium]|nr:hypothetical protein [Lachnospiraceae bacterium]